MANSNNGLKFSKQSLWYQGILLFLLIIFLSIVYSRKNGQDGFLRIGVLAPISGLMSGHGHSIETGARVAEKQINENGGIVGRKIQLVVLDTNSDPTTTAQRASELVGRHNVSFVIGTGTSAETLAAIPILTAAKTPFFYSLDGECKTCSQTDSLSPNAFVWGTGFSERMVVRPLLESLSGILERKSENLKVFLIGGDYVYPRTTNAYAKKVSKELGFEVVGEEYSDTATQDYTPVIRRIASSGADLLIVTNPGASGVTFMRQAKQMGLDRSLAISGFATFDQEAIIAMGDSSDGVFCVNRYCQNLDNIENQEFLKRFREMYPNDSTLPGPTAAAGAYGAILVAKAAFEKTKTLDIEKFCSAVNGLSVKLPQGNITVNPVNHIFEQPIYIMQIKNGEYQVVSKIEKSVHPGFEGCSVPTQKELSR